MKNDFKLLGEMYTSKVSKDYYAQIVLLVHESNYSNNQKQILIEYIDNNTEHAFSLYEADMSRRGFLGALGKAVLGAGAAAMGIGGNSAQAQQQSSDPLTDWIKEIEAWSKVFSGDEDNTIEKQKFDTVIKKLQGMSNSDKQRYNESCLSSSTHTNVFGGGPAEIQQRQKYGNDVFTRNMFLKSQRYLGMGNRGNGVNQEALAFLIKVMRTRKPEDILKLTIKQRRMDNPNDNNALNATAPKLENPNTWISLGLDTY